MNKQPMTVLVADDDPGVLTLMSEIMALEGWEVWQARDGDQAVEYALSVSPTAALLDVMMPGLDGTQVAAMMRDVIPVMIFVSALADRDWMVKGIMSGGEDWVTKPFEPSQLPVRVSTWAASSGVSLVSSANPGKIHSPE